MRARAVVALAVAAVVGGGLLLAYEQAWIGAPHIAWNTAEADGRAVTVTADGGGCMELALRVHESADEVELTVVDAHARLSGPRACTMMLELIRLTAILDAPIGARLVVDGTTGRTRTALDVARRLDPTYLPDKSGLHLSNAYGGPDSDQAYWELEYTIGTALVIDQGPAASMPPAAGTRHGGAVVRGHPAEVRYDGSTAVIRWTEGDYAYVVSVGPGSKTATPQAYQVIAQRVADGLR